MAKLVSIECDNCAAKVPSKTTYGTFVCQYCGHQFRIESPVAARPPAPGHVPRAVHVDPSRVQSSVKKILFAIAFVFILTGVCTSLLIRQVTKKATEVTQQISSSFNRPASKRAAAANADNPRKKTERLTWDEVGGPPLLVSLGGKEHVVGRMRDLESGQLSVRIYDAATLDERFRTPDLGTYSDAYRSAWFGVAGQRLLVTDGSNSLQAFAPATGEELATHPLTDQAKQLCSLGGSEVWVEVIDENHIVYNAETLTAKAAPKRPSRCPTSATIRRRRLRNAGRGAPSRLKGLRVGQTFVDGDDAVAYAFVTPGTPLPMAVGFSPKTKEVRWREPVMQADSTTYRKSFRSAPGGLAKGRFIAVYGVGQHGFRVAAKDAETGAALWDVELDKSRGSDDVKMVLVSDEFVYLARRSKLEVLRAKDGSAVGTVGR